MASGVCRRCGVPLDDHEWRKDPTDTALDTELLTTPRCPATGPMKEAA